MSQIQNRFKIGYLRNNGYQQQPLANIGHQMCISVNFVFICSILFSYVQFCKRGGRIKMLNFQVACAQKFQNKNDSFLRCQQIWNVVIN